MKREASVYFKELNDLFGQIIVTDKKNKSYHFDEAIDSVIKMIIKQSSSGGKLMFIGNGGSASIASHMAVDFWKNAGIRALSFNDAALLTCISNDYGYKQVFEKPVEAFADSADILVAISSSGKSENILLGVAAAKKRKAKVVTLSGFDKNNPLRKLGDINFYISASHYGYVETVHLSICHCLVDLIIKTKTRL